MRWLRALFALGAVACGARTDLGAPRPVSTGNPPDSGGTLPAIACVAKVKSVLSKGTTSDVDVRIDAAYVYWNDGAHIVRAPKNGGAPEVVVDAVVDPGAFDTTGDGTVVYAAHGSTQVQRSDGTVLGVVSRPSVELVTFAGGTTYVIAAQGASEGLFAIASSNAQLVALLPVTAPDSLGQGQFPQAAFDLVIDGASAFVSVIGQTPLPSKVLAVSMDTGDVTTLSQMPLSLPGSALAVDSQYVYYASSFGQDAPAIFSVPRTGGATIAVVPTQTYCASCSRTSLASDGTSIYFSAGEFGQNVASWTPGTPNDPTLLAETSNDAAVTGIRSDGSCVYWVVANDPNVYVAPILK